MLAAVRKGDAAAVKALLAKGADVNAKSPYGATGLFFAADRGNVEMVKILLEHGATANVKDTFYGASAVTWALQKNRIEIVKLLLEKGASADDVLMPAINRGDAALLKAVLARGGLKPDELTSALVVATQRNRADLADLLKKAGAAAPVEFPVDAATLSSYAGSYKGDFFDLKVEVEDGKLMATLQGLKNPLRAVERATFKQDAMGVTLVFDANSVTSKFGTDSTVLKKVESK